jgi:hypothetical protein
MKITKARLKEIIREELINEGMDEGLVDTLKSYLTTGDEGAASARRRKYQPELNPKEKELVDFLTSKNSDIIKAVTNIQKAQKTIIDKTAEADEKSKALEDMKTALQALMAARTIPPGNPGRTSYLKQLTPLEEGDFFGKPNPYEISPQEASEMQALAREISKVSKDPSLVQKLLMMLKSAGVKVGEIIDDHSRLSEGEACEDDDGDGEGKMADSQLNRIADLATMIDEMVDDDTNLPEWVESKITKSLSYMSDAMDYMKGKKADDQEAQEEIIDEET